jgi:hypothetical protein
MSRLTPPLPPLDVDTIRAAARDWVTVRLNDATTDQDIVSVATKIIGEQTPELDKARMRRDQIALSVREYGPDAKEPIPSRRRGVALAEATGLSRARLQTLRDQWPVDYGLPPLVLNARTELPKYAAKTCMHDARVTVAREARDAAIVRLIEAGVPSNEIAELMGRDPSRVRQMIGQAKRRHADAVA